MEKEIVMKDLEKANEAREFSHCPYSDFAVGAALRTKDGKIYTGCNVENHGIQGICAERTAFVKALSSGEREFESIAVVGGPFKKNIESECLPCGYCRQFMSEFVDGDFKVYSMDKDGNIKEYTMKELLPYGFDFQK